MRDMRCEGGCKDFVECGARVRDVMYQERARM